MSLYELEKERPAFSDRPRNIRRREKRRYYCITGHCRMMFQGRGSAKIARQHAEDFQHTIARGPEIRVMDWSVRPGGPAINDSQRGGGLTLTFRMTKRDLSTQNDPC